MAAPLRQRAAAMLTSPRTEWPVVAAEPETVPGLYLRYILPLSAIGPIVLVARFASLGWLGLAVMQYLLQLAAVYVCARIIGALAPRFHARDDGVQALKLVAYAATPSWIADGLGVVPGLRILTVAGLVYSVYLYYLGVTPVMRTPPEQVVPFTLVSAILVVVGFTIASAIVGVLLGGAIGVLRL